MEGIICPNCKKSVLKWGKIPVTLFIINDRSVEDLLNYEYCPECGFYVSERIHGQAK